jgi:hypothetical protein
MNATNTLKPPFCENHRTPMIWGETDFTFAEDGIEVTVRHIPAWVCIHGDDAAFPPDITDELIVTIRKLIRVAQQARLDYPALGQPEYLVRATA